MVSRIKQSKVFIKIKPPIARIYNFFIHWKRMIPIFINNYFNVLFKFKPSVMTIEESINYIIKNKSSLSRFGDGEMYIIMGGSLKFQEYSEKLASRLEEVLEVNIDNHEVGIPDVFSFLDKYKGYHREFWEKNIYENRQNWYKFLDKDRRYINSFISRCYMNYKSKKKCGIYFSLIQNIWNDKEIIIIEGEESRLGIGNDLFNGAKSIQRILAPKENAFSVYDSILNTAKKLPLDKIILIALGPTATVLAYDLCKLGYQAIDIGHIDLEYEWYLLGATEKINIPNKYVHESEDGRNTHKFHDEIYENQIIYRINRGN